MGMDSFREIPTWKESRHVFSLTNFVVTTRPGFQMENIDRVFVNSVFRGMDFTETREGEAFGCRSVKATESPYSIFILETNPVQISSTEIRERIKKGATVSGYLPQEIEDYIIGNGIYWSFTKTE